MRESRFGGTTELDEHLDRLAEAARNQPAPAGRAGRSARGAKPGTRTVTAVAPPRQQPVLPVTPPSPLRTLPPAALTEDARTAWRDAPGHDRMPGPDRFTVEQVRAGLGVTLHQAVEQALAAAGTDVDDSTRAAIRGALTATRVRAGLPSMIEGTFLLPAAGGQGGHIVVDARLVTGATLVDADSTSRALSYRAEFRVIARFTGTGGVGLAGDDAVTVWMNDADAERITGRELPASVRASAADRAAAQAARTAASETGDHRLRQAEDAWRAARDRHRSEVGRFRGDPVAGRIVWETEKGDRVVGDGGYAPSGTPLLPGGADTVARVFDAYEPVGGGSFEETHPVLASPAELQLAIDHLSGGRVLLRTAARERDVYAPDGPPVVPLGYRTDGRWVWSEATAYYLATYGLNPDPSLLAHIRARGSVRVGD
ncbi:hypothetical protein Ait01nite_056000 [Actinoplanes italicus]|uniref:Uncharacterized protein n=1 Tax=Actinoplanes italicus TaxID=113567 RepID=A0A2T0K764_9ACTN|nr:hypothetical protein [Actinoplanes italicus]PRX18868.1 hypothetical protein CLV67_11115 [Actinoplanes italicus]GIE32555.1 hypothetical protein Ait01nite_056000 [Actinoplanes italicus]